MIKRIFPIALLVFVLMIGPVTADDDHTYTETIIAASSGSNSWGTTTDANILPNGTLLVCVARAQGSTQTDRDMISWDGGASFTTLTIWGGSATRGGSCDFIDGTNQYGRVYTDTSSNTLRFARFDFVNTTTLVNTAISNSASCCIAQTASINTTHHVVMWVGATNNNIISQSTDGGATWTITNTGLTQSQASNPKYGHSCISAEGKGTVQCAVQATGGLRFFDIDANGPYTMVNVTNYGGHGYQPDLFYNATQDAFGMCGYSAGGDLTYFRSTDDGATWVSSLVDGSSDNAEECSVDQAANGVVGILDDEEFYHSSDNGATWGLKNQSDIAADCCNGPDNDMIKQSAGFMIYGQNFAQTHFVQLEVLVGAAAATTTAGSVLDDDSPLWGGNKTDLANDIRVTEAGLESLYGIAMVLFFMGVGVVLAGSFGAIGGSAIGLVGATAFGWLPAWVGFLMFAVILMAVLFVKGSGD